MPPIIKTLQLKSILKWEPTLQYNHFFYHSSNLPPSQGGRYSGFGNTMETPQKNQSDLLENAVSSLASVSTNSIVCKLNLAGSELSIIEVNEKLQSMRLKAVFPH